MTHRKGSAGTTAAIAIALVALAIAVYGVYSHREVTPLKEATAEQNDLFRQITGVDNPHVTNALNARYADADGDLVADAPKDATKQLDPAALTFSYVAVEDDATFREAFKDLVAALSKATGKPVEFVSYDSFEDELRAIRDGKLHVAGLNTGSVPIGVCTAGFVPVAQLANPDGSAGYHMQIITPAGSGLGDKLADLRGHELTLTEPSSNSGYKAPLVLLREAGLRPPTDYLIRYSQGHLQSIEGIKTKRFEAAAVAEDVLKREIAEGRIAAGDYKVIYTSDQLFPGACLGYASTLKPELADKIRGVLTNFDFKGTGLEKLFGPEGRTKLVPVDYKKDFAFVRRIDESIGFPYTLRDAKPTTVPTTQAALPLSREDQVRVTLAEIQKRLTAEKPPRPRNPFEDVAILIPTN